MTRDNYKEVKFRHQRGGIIRNIAGILASFLCGYLIASLFGLTNSINWIQEHWLNLQNSNPGSTEITAATADTSENPTKPKFEFYTLLAKENGPVANAREALRATATTTTTPVGSNQKMDSSLERTAALPNAKTEIKGENDKVTITQNTEPLSSEKVVPVIESQSVANQQGLPESTGLATKLANKETYMIQVVAVTRREDAERLKSSLMLKGYSVMIATFSQANTTLYRVVIGPFHSRQEAERAQVNISRTEHIQGMIRKIDV